MKTENKFQEFEKGVHNIDCNIDECSGCVDEYTNYYEMDPDERFLHYDWIFSGIRSGFPLCCIFWFCNVWDENFRKNITDEWYQFGDGYIRCPKCLADEMEKQNG